MRSLHKTTFSISSQITIEHIIMDNASIMSKNSTCPSPPSPTTLLNHHIKKPEPQYQLSRDLTNLYELFATAPNNTNVITYKESLVCYCCEREIINSSNSKSNTTTTEVVDGQQQQQQKRKLDQFISKNKITTALYYGSNQVRKYMKKVMTRDNWNDIIKQGFPCPHIDLWKKQREQKNHFFCTLCDTTDQTQHTLRLTLTPSTCRAQDKEIYGEYQQLQKQSFSKNKKKRRGMIHLG